MYLIHPTHNIQKPSHFLRQLNSELVKRFNQTLLKIKKRKIHIFLPKKSSTFFGLDPNNQSVAFTHTTPDNPQVMLPKLIVEMIKDIGKDTYINVLGFPTIQVIDPLTGDIPEELKVYNVSFRNYGGDSVALAKKIHEQKLKIYEWYKQRGIEIKELKKPFDEKFEKKCLRKINRIYTKILGSYLDSQAINSLYIFSYMPENCWESRILKKVVSGRNYIKFFYKSFHKKGDKLGYNSPRSINSFGTYISTQLNLKKPKKIKVKSNCEWEFWFPPKLDPESKSYNPFYDEDENKFTIEEKKQRTLENFDKRMVDDRIRLKMLLEKYNVTKEDIPNYLPIETLFLIIKNKHSIETVFKLKRKEARKERADFTASQINSLCELDYLYNITGIKPKTKPQVIGSLVHEISLKDPDGNYDYVNWYILEIGGIGKIKRERYCEISTMSEIGDILIESTHDSAFLDRKNNIVLVDYKTSIVEYYKYRLPHAQQLCIEKINLENQGYDVADYGFIIYLKGPDPEDILGYKPLIKLVWFNEDLVSLSLKDMNKLVKVKEACTKNPLKVYEIYDAHKKRECLCTKIFSKNYVDLLYEKLSLF